MREIIKLLKETRETEEKALEMLDKDVDRIIKNNVKDISIIEGIFDTLLSFVLVDTSNVFNKLNNYYETINSEYSKEYKLIYQDQKEKE